MHALILLIASLVAFPAAAATGDLLVFVLAGQSNMSGRGAVAELPPDFPRHRGRLWSFSNADRWIEAAEPIDDATGQVDAVSADPSAGVGPGLAFADALAASLPDVRIGLVPCAKGATSIREWQSSNARDALFGSCLRRIRLACPEGRIAGILWHQGESDAATAADARLWGTRFAEVVKGFRSELGDETLPVIAGTLGRLGETRRTDPAFKYWDEVVAAQRAVRLPGVAFVDGHEFEMRSDGLHLSTRGQLALGEAMAKQLVAHGGATDANTRCSVPQLESRGN
jgi:hypothetical protein